MNLFENEKVNMSPAVLDWLLESSDPAVRYRTLTELLNTQSDDDVMAAKKSLVLSENVKSALVFFEVGKAYTDAYAFSALAEYGLTRRDLDIDQHVEKYITQYGFADGCGEGFLLRNLVMLGYADHPKVKSELAAVLATQQSDGGYPCISKNPKIKKPNVPHKSCFQMSTSYLLLIAELHKQGMVCSQSSALIEYFLGRDVLFRHDNPVQVVKAEMGTTFHPPVATRIGLHQILYSLAVLDKASDPRCDRAWSLLENRCGPDGKYVIDGSLTKPYIKTEKPKKANKWVTFYALLAKKYSQK